MYNKPRGTSSRATGDTSFVQAGEDLFNVYYCTACCLVAPGRYMFYSGLQKGICDAFLLHEDKL